jgi:hypothetical protein
VSTCIGVSMGVGVWLCGCGGVWLCGCVGVCVCVCVRMCIGVSMDVGVWLCGWLGVWVGVCMGVCVCVCVCVCVFLTNCETAFCCQYYNFPLPLMFSMNKLERLHLKVFSF